MIVVLRLLRVNQYVKNLFIFLPIFFALKFQETNLLIGLLKAFFSFCLVASAVYIMNDLKDFEVDQKHPKKKFRPIASGKISKKTAVVFLISTLFSGFFLAFISNLNLFFILLFYFIMNIFYSFSFKHIPLLDIFIVSFGFLLRLFAGTDYAGIVGVKPSEWIILMTFLLALFLALAKRRDDVLLSLEGKNTRKSIEGYNLELINSMLSIMVAVILVAYIMYTMSPVVTTHFGSNKIYLTTIFVLLGMFRYLQITFVLKKSGSPTDMLLKDRFLQLTIVSWLGSFLLIYFLGRQ